MTDATGAAQQAYEMAFIHPCQLLQLGDNCRSWLKKQASLASTAKGCDNEAVYWVILYGTYAC